MICFAYRMFAFLVIALAAAGTIERTTATAAHTLPQDPVARDSVDLIEVNHLYDWDGTLTFSQLILWDWCDSDKCYHVVAWRMVKSQSQRPTRDYTTGEWVVIFMDDGLLRMVRSRQFCETWVQGYDPELEDRSQISVPNRRGLAGERKR